MYRTTAAFLEQTGLDSLEQLPPLAPYMPANPDLSQVLAAETADMLWDAQTQQSADGREMNETESREDD